MIRTVLLGFVTGFMAGNGLPYYSEGSVGRGINPSPFPDSPQVSVCVGTTAMAIAGTAAWHADLRKHPVSGALATGAGWLAVGLIHAGIWSADPWGKRRRGTPASTATTGQ